MAAEPGLPPPPGGRRDSSKEMLYTTAQGKSAESAIPSPKSAPRRSRNKRELSAGVDHETSTRRSFSSSRASEGGDFDHEYANQFDAAGMPMLMQSGHQGSNFGGRPGFGGSGVGGGGGGGGGGPLQRGRSSYRSHRRSSKGPGHLSDPEPSPRDFPEMSPEQFHLQQYLVYERILAQKVENRDLFRRDMRPLWIWLLLLGVPTVPVDEELAMARWNIQLFMNNPALKAPLMEQQPPPPQPPAVAPARQVSRRRLQASSRDAYKRQLSHKRRREEVGADDNGGGTTLSSEGRGPPSDTAAAHAAAVHAAAVVAAAKIVPATISPPVATAETPSLQPQQQQQNPQLQQHQHPLQRRMPSLDLFGGDFSEQWETFQRRTGGAAHSTSISTSRCSEVSEEVESAVDSGAGVGGGDGGGGGAAARRRGRRVVDEEQGEGVVMARAAPAHQPLPPLNQAPPQPQSQPHALPPPPQQQQPPPPQRVPVGHAHAVPPPAGSNPPSEAARRSASTAALSRYGPPGPTASSRPRRSRSRRRVAPLPGGYGPTLACLSALPTVVWRVCIILCFLGSFFAGIAIQFTNDTNTDVAHAYGIGFLALTPIPLAAYLSLVWRNPTPRLGFLIAEAFRFLSSPQRQHPYADQLMSSTQYLITADRVPNPLTARRRPTVDDVRRNVSRLLLMGLIVCFLVVAVMNAALARLFDVNSNVSSLSLANVQRIATHITFSVTWVALLGVISVFKVECYLLQTLGGAVAEVIRMGTLVDADVILHVRWYALLLEVSAKAWGAMLTTVTVSMTFALTIWLVIFLSIGCPGCAWTDKLVQMLALVQGVACLLFLLASAASTSGAVSAILESVSVLSSVRRSSIVDATGLRGGRGGALFSTFNVLGIPITSVLAGRVAFLLVVTLGIFTIRMLTPNIW